MGKSDNKKEATEREKTPHSIDIRFIFKKQERIRERKDYLKAFFKGEKIVDNCLVLFVLPTERKCTRLGISINKKVGRSVRRNRIKRILREIFRLNKHKLKKGHDIVFVVRKAATEKNYRQLEEIVLNLLKKATLFKAD